MKNIQRAGELFIYSLWIKGQMADLIVLNNRPDLIKPFLESPSTIPPEFAAERFSAWKDDFGLAKQAFVLTFGDSLEDEDLADLEFIHAIRNAIAHCHVSVGREYFLYRPTGGARREQAIIRALQLARRDEQSDPMMVKLAFFNDDFYNRAFGRIKRLDEVCFPRIASEVGVTHSRIR